MKYIIYFETNEEIVYIIIYINNFVKIRCYIRLELNFGLLFFKSNETRKGLQGARTDREAKAYANCEQTPREWKIRVHTRARIGRDEFCCRPDYTFLQFFSNRAHTTCIFHEF